LLLFSLQMSLFDALTDPFASLCAEGILREAAVFLDDASAETVRWIGGLRLVRNLGARWVLPLPQTGAFASASSASSASSSSSASASTPAVVLPAGGCPRRVAVVIVSVPLWDVEAGLRAVVTSGLFDRVVVCSALAPADHGLDWRRPKVTSLFSDDGRADPDDGALDVDDFVARLGGGGGGGDGGPHVEVRPFELHYRVLLREHAVGGDNDADYLDDMAAAAAADDDT